MDYVWASMLVIEAMSIRQCIEARDLQPDDAFAAVDYFEKLQLKQLDRKKPQGGVRRRILPSRRDVYERVDKIADPEERAAALKVELEAWDARVGEMWERVTEAKKEKKEQRKATRMERKSQKAK